MREAPPKCLETGPDCQGPVKCRISPDASGKSWPRCEKHAGDWYERYADNQSRYPLLTPTDFDPSYAGEQWDEDY